MDHDSFRLDGYTYSVQTTQKIFPGLFGVWAILHIEELDSFHRPIIVEKCGLLGEESKPPAVSTAGGLM